VYASLRVNAPSRQDGGERPRRASPLRAAGTLTFLAPTWPSPAPRRLSPPPLWHHDRIGVVEHRGLTRHPLRTKSRPLERTECPRLGALDYLSPRRALLGRDGLRVPPRRRARRHRAGGVARMRAPAAAAHGTPRRRRQHGLRRWVQVRRGRPSSRGSRGCADSSAAGRGVALIRQRRVEGLR
jgi:hypothetical protein